jgi:hypothetical protein
VYQTPVENQAMLDFCDAFDGISGAAIVTDGMPGMLLVHGNIEVLLAGGLPPLRGVRRCRLAMAPHAGDCIQGNVLLTAHEYQGSESTC